MRSESWLRLMSGLVLVAVFAFGALFGAGLLRWTERPSERLPPPPHGGPSGGAIEAMKRELQLTEPQVAQLQTIADAHRGELDAIARRTQREVRDVLFSIENELAPHLSAEQRQRLDHWRTTRRPPPPPPGMGPPPGMEPPGPH